ncbi:hypothetical protein HFP43_06820 [Streptomyces sp. SJ1-7]|nr:hypothetical protein [Streptomyces sp. SJ1-7]
MSGTALADRIERYVHLHPYVRTLVMNVVNAGRAEIVADALLELQRRTPTRDLTYDIRLCVSDPEAPESGAALGELISTQSQFSSTEAEAFLHAAEGTRSAKLVYSVRSVEEFRKPGAEFDAHLTVLIDAFGGEQHGSVTRHDIAHAPVHGLVQPTASTYEESEQQIVWRTMPRHGIALPAEDAEDLATLLSRLPGLLAGAAANVATAGQAPRHVPCTVLSLDTTDRALLYQAHQVGDWVVTIDKTLGLEYFDHAGQRDRPEYVIDYAPSLDSGLGHQIMVSSNSVDELRTLLGPTAQQHGLDVEQRHLNTFFEQLSLLSGNLAFKLASTAPPSARKYSAWPWPASTWTTRAHCTTRSSSLWTPTPSCTPKPAARPGNSATPSPSSAAILPCSTSTRGPGPSPAASSRSSATPRSTTSAPTSASKPR